MGRIKWLPFTMKNDCGKDIVMDMECYNGTIEAMYLLQEIARMPKKDKKPISVAAAYDLMLTVVGDLVFIHPEEGNGKKAAHYFNQGFVQTATELGYYIALTGDEFEVAGLAA